MGFSYRQADQISATSPLRVATIEARTVPAVRHLLRIERTMQSHHDVRGATASRKWRVIKPRMPAGGDR
jgi:hypothetical protein